MIKTVVDENPKTIGQIVSVVRRNGLTTPVRIGRVVKIIGGVPVTVWESSVKCWRYGKPWQYGKPWRYASSS